jgi:hypothetical protein
MISNKILIDFNSFVSFLNFFIVESFIFIHLISEDYLRNTCWFTSLFIFPSIQISHLNEPFNQEISHFHCYLFNNKWGILLKHSFYLCSIIVPIFSQQGFLFLYNLFHCSYFYLFLAICNEQRIFRIYFHLLIFHYHSSNQ